MVFFYYVINLFEGIQQWVGGEVEVIYEFGIFIYRYVLFIVLENL